MSKNTKEELDYVRCELGLAQYDFDDRFENNFLFNNMVLLLIQKNKIINELKERIETFSVNCGDEI